MAAFTFDNDDEPDKLDLNTGGDNGTQNPVPEKKVAPVTPQSPFKSAPARPQKDVLSQLGRPGVKRPEPTPAVQLPPATPQPVAQPIVAPPVAVQPVQVPTPPVVTQPAPVEVPTYIPEYVEEQPVYESTLLKQSQQAPQQQIPQQPSLQQSAPAEAAQFQPAQYQQQVRPAQQYYQGNPDMAYDNPLFETEEKTPTESTAKSKKGKKPTKRGNFAGDRWKVVAVRAVIIIIAIVIGFNGIKNIVAPNSGPTRAQVVGAAQQAVGYTKFPTVEGGGNAIGFTKTFLNYSSATGAASARDTALLKYAPQNIVEEIDPTFGANSSTSTSSTPDSSLTGGSAVNDSGNSTAGGGSATNDNSAPVTTQTITDGPYLIDSKNIDDTHAVFTTLSQIDGKTWVYLQIPMLYDPTHNSLSVSGFPSFIPPTTVGKVPDSEVTPAWSDDQSVDSSFQADLINYLTAWASSNHTVIPRYITKDATLPAKAGLGGIVSYSKLTNLTVEDITASPTTDANTRRAQFTVIWNDAKDNVSYTQTYRLIIKYQGGRWYISDIENPALISGANTAPAVATP
jgi:hypothetical protein